MDVSTNSPSPLDLLFVLCWAPVVLQPIQLVEEAITRMDLLSVERLIYSLGRVDSTPIALHLSIFLLVVAAVLFAVSSDSPSFHWKVNDDPTKSRERTGVDRQEWPVVRGYFRSKTTTAHLCELGRITRTHTHTHTTRFFSSFSQIERVTQE